ncbi:hypothetical protein [Streptosporangium sp. LJ11]|uniref:hypothetical protein n=1 Tax=Streptosporangium sp. LJ11 TaxID=3436927 RepID=UPI003F790A93
MRRCPAGGPGSGLALLCFGAFAGLCGSGADPLGCGRGAAARVIAWETSCSCSWSRVRWLLGNRARSPLFFSASAACSWATRCWARW